MRKKTARRLQVNVFPNPFHSWLTTSWSAVMTPGMWLFIALRLGKSTCGLVTSILPWKSWAFLTSSRTRETYSANISGRLQWLNSSERTLGFIVPFQSQGKGGLLSFHLSAVGLVLVFQFLGEGVFLPKRRPPLYLCCDSKIQDNHGGVLCLILINSCLKKMQP